MYVHLVARTLFGMRPFQGSAKAWDLWSSLSRGTPAAIAACLMPNHLHLIEETTDPDAARRRLALRLAAFSRREGWPRLWERLPPACHIPHEQQLLRQIRYVHLNPCRARLVDDPLCWPWSTHRGAVGAVLEPWVTPERLAASLGRPVDGFASWFHRYVSADPHVAAEGTPLPTAEPSRTVAELPLALVLDAARAAAPAPIHASLRRQLGVALAYDQGWRDAKLVAGALGITPHAVRRIVRTDSACRLRHVPGL